MRGVADTGQNQAVDGFISRVRAMLQARGITANALGERAGLQRGHINHILSGTRKSVNADTLLAIAKVLGVTTDWLLTGEGPIERPASPSGEMPRVSPPMQRMTNAVESFRAKTQAAAENPPAPAAKRLPRR